jgi:outer membrane protein OmpA-like peptidoglycan-associated protein
LVARGISPDRLEYEGKGSSEPLEAGNNEVNRRTQIIVLQ